MIYIKVLQRVAALLAGTRIAAAMSTAIAAKVTAKRVTHETAITSTK